MGNQFTNPWGPDRVYRLKKLFRDDLAYREIAAALETTIGSVAGKLNKLGLIRRDNRSRSESEKAATLLAQRERDRLAKRDRRAANRPALGVGAQIQAINRRNESGPIMVALHSNLRTAPVVSKRKSIVELEDQECRYPDPEGDPLKGIPHTFCGRHTERKESYCKEHALLIPGKGTTGERQATAVSRKQAA